MRVLSNSLQASSFSLEVKIMINELQQAAQSSSGQVRTKTTDVVSYSGYLCWISTSLYSCCRISSESS